jgi:hypothetical protein
LSGGYLKKMQIFFCTVLTKMGLRDGEALLKRKGKLEKNKTWMQKKFGL